VDTTLDKSIKAFQKDNKLRVDGVIKPNGPTIRRLIDGDDVVDNDEDARSPRQQCVECGGWHGGAFGDLCEWCVNK
jgi:hypothetical protein